jgi:cephalosporin-C deacetylase-like acetyl esterase
MRSALLLVALVTSGAPAADFKDVDPNVFPKDDPRAKELPGMMWADAKRRMQEANLRESKAFAEVKTKAQWEAYRDARVAKLKESLGVWPAVPKDMRVKVTRELDGDGFVIRCVVYETRPGFWACANLYLPKKPPEKMPGIIIAHSHHGGKTGGELQDMGMTWARAGVAVLVPDQLGYGERREHDFNSNKDYDKPFRVGRQDYFFRYNSNLQLSAIGDSLMGWMVWDLMRGVDVLLMQKNIDRDRIMMVGSVAGGGDPVGVTAALDSRVACVVPFNFGGWQPESRQLENTDRDTPWFGDGYWESTRGLRNGARDGFAHFVIVGSVAPRKVIYAHEFAWDANTDPAWPRLQKVFDFYGAKDSLRVAFGKGKVTGPGGPDNTHCNHIGAVHRKMIYPALKDWFGMPIPEEYSKPRPGADLKCWTDEARAELKPKKLHELLAVLRDRWNAELPSDFPANFLDLPRAACAEILGKSWAKMLGGVEPFASPKLIEGKPQDVTGGRLERLALEVEPGTVVPFVLLTPKEPKAKLPVVVMVAQGGKAGFLKQRPAVLEQFLKSGFAVCLVDVRGTGETQAGDGSAGRGSARTSISQTNLILGQPVLGLQLRDLRTVIRWLGTRADLDGKRFAVWGDSFAPANATDARFAVPLDAPNPLHFGEPGGATLAALAAFYEKDARAVFRHGGLLSSTTQIDTPYIYVPHEAIVPEWSRFGDRVGVSLYTTCPREFRAVIGLRNLATVTTPPNIDDAKWVIEQFKK